MFTSKNSIFKNSLLKEFNVILKTMPDFITAIHVVPQKFNYNMFDCGKFKSLSCIK